MAAASATCKHAGPRGDAERFAGDPTVRAGEAALPARLLKICGARFVVREKALELRERFWKRKVGAIENVHCSPISASYTHPLSGLRGRQAGNRPSLDVVGVCVNRIGTVQSSCNPGFRAG